MADQKSNGASGRPSWKEELKGSANVKVENPRNLTYLKTGAVFSCSKCSHSWTSAHAWGTMAGQGPICTGCNKRQFLVNAIDMYLYLDTFNCPHCHQTWQSLHSDDVKAPKDKKCSDCGFMVSPEPESQKRFGRRFWSRCVTLGCPLHDKLLDDYTVGLTQKGQRCGRCQSVAYLRSLHMPNTKEEREKRARQNLEWRAKWIAKDQGITLEAAIKMEEEAKKDRPSHPPHLCDMCMDIRDQKRGPSCYHYRRVVSKLEKNDEGDDQEIITEVHQTVN